MICCIVIAGIVFTGGVGVVCKFSSIFGLVSQFFGSNIFFIVLALMICFVQNTFWNCFEINIFYFHFGGL